MKTNALTLLLAAAVGIAACARQTPPPTGPQGPSGPTTAQPPPNPNPEPPVPPVATPVSVAPSAPSAPKAAAPAGSVPLAAAVPDQPVIAAGDEPPSAPARPYREILELKKTGAADDVILNKVRTDNVNYRLTTAEVIELRGAGLSETILEAMLRSGQPSPSARK